MTFHYLSMFFFIVGSYVLVKDHTQAFGPVAFLATVLFALVSWIGLKSERDHFPALLGGMVIFTLLGGVIVYGFPASWSLENLPVPVFPRTR